jgi:hypothetical protein
MIHIALQVGNGRVGRLQENCGALFTEGSRIEINALRARERRKKEQQSCGSGQEMETSWH